MTSSLADISSAATVLEDLAARLARIADSYVAEEREEMATELYDAEAALAVVARRLRRVAGGRR